MISNITASNDNPSTTTKKSKLSKKSATATKTINTANTNVTNSQNNYVTSSVFYDTFDKAQ